MKRAFMERLGLTDEQLADESFGYFGHRPNGLSSSRRDTPHLQMLRANIFRRVRKEREGSVFDASKMTPPIGAYSRDDPETHFANVVSKAQGPRWGELLRFIDLFTRPGYAFGEWVERSRGVFLAYSSEALDFQEVVYTSGVIVTFNWTKWSGAARLIEDPKFLAKARLATLRRLLTAHVRQERFVEGHLLGLFASGHLASILRRIEELIGARKLRASACLFGVALGDALGAPVEFVESIEAIRSKFPPDGPQAPLGSPARVTDDTQMTLAVGEALVAARPITPASLERELRRAFVAWSKSPENDRAPGVTCMRACGGLGAGLPWIEATVVASKGAGANMRVAPVAFLTGGRDGVDAQLRGAIAQLQAAMTHGHPTALAASDLTVQAIVELASGTDPERVVKRLRRYARAQRHTYHAAWLGDELWQRAGFASPKKFIARGWDECIVALDRVERACARVDRTGDPCELTGAGWVAEEAFATGLLCFLMFPSDPLAALRRAALTSGDSDSIACLTGAFAGAWHGGRAWPEEWCLRIEYADRLRALAHELGS